MFSTSVDFSALSSRKAVWHAFLQVSLYLFDVYYSLVLYKRRVKAFPVDSSVRDVIYKGLVIGKPQK